MVLRNSSSLVRCSSGAVVVACLVSCLSACSSSSSSGSEQDKGLEGEGSGIPAGTDTNPEGKAYPTARIGTKASTHKKTAAGTPGDIMKNFKFYGYPKGDKSNGLQPVSLANYYDPEGKTYRLIHIQAAGVWCGPCNQEAKAAAPLSDEFTTKKIGWITALVETSKRGAPSVPSDLDKWLTSYPSTFSHVLDPNNAQFGVFFDAAAIPWNGDLDARTMEILYASTGGLATQEAIRDDLDGWLKFLDTYPPAK